jgi:hypothetical protein
MIYIYTLSCPETKEIRYVGKTCNLKSRYSNHINKFYNNHKSNWIKSLLSKGLKPIMEVIEEVEDELNWEMLEIYWIAQFKAWGFDLTNIDEGGKFINFTQEVKDKISKANKGRKWTDEAREKASIRCKEIGMKPISILKNAHLFRTEESFKKISESKIGKKRPQETIDKMKATSYLNSRLTEEDVKNIWDLYYNKKLFQWKIGELYGISQSDVHGIVKRKRFVDWTKEL